MNERPRHVVIVGREAALWLTATAIAEALGSTGVAVTAIELPSKLGAASAYTALPAIESLHARLGIDESRMLRATGGSFSLGWNIVQADRPPFMLAHGSYGAPIDGGDFFAYWVKARRFGLTAAYEDFSPTAMAARHGRILFPDAATEQFGRTDYGYHLPAIGYASVLKSRAQQLGVMMHQALAVQVERKGEDGSIISIKADDREAIRGDLFVDASGSDAFLIGNALGIDAESWGQFFPLKHRVTAAAKRFASVPTYAELRLSPSSWTALHGGPTATEVVHAYGEESDEVALANAGDQSGLALADAVITRSAPALRSMPWTSNCVAIGASACALDPLLDLDLHAIQLGIVHLLSLFPTTRDAGPERAEYNRLIRSHFERVRDFQAAVYWLAGIAKAAPPTLLRKMETFGARGTIAPMEDETFSPDQWRALLVGQGLMPETWAPAIDTTPPERIKEGFRRILGFVREKVLDQPTLDACLTDIAAGRPA